MCAVVEGFNRWRYDVVKGLIWFDLRDGLVKGLIWFDLRGGLVKGLIWFDLRGGLAPLPIVATVPRRPATLEPKKTSAAHSIYIKHSGTRSCR